MEAIRPCPQPRGRSCSWRNVLATEPENPIPAQDDDLEMRNRLAALSRDLKRNQARSAEKPKVDLTPSNMGQAVGLGVRVTSEFVAAVAVGGLIGWQLDKWLHWSPACLIVFLGLGTAAGFWNVYRLATQSGSK